jgi:hypothetical protein
VCECELDATGVAQHGHEQAQYAARFEKVVACVCVCECELDATGVAQHGHEQAQYAALFDASVSKHSVKRNIP